MSYYILFGHFKKVYVKKNQVLNGKTNIGYIGSTGQVSGPHCHVQYQKTKTGSWLETFWSDSDSSDPNIIFDQFGLPSPNDVTTPYHYQPYPYNASGKHQGVDFSGVIDKSYESPYVYNFPKAKSKVLETGYDPQVFGNYVVIEVLGKKEEPKKNKYNVIKVFTQYKYDKSVHAGKYGDNLGYLFTYANKYTDNKLTVDRMNSVKKNYWYYNDDIKLYKVVHEKGTYLYKDSNLTKKVLNEDGTHKNVPKGEFVEGKFYKNIFK